MDFSHLIQVYREMSSFKLSYLLIIFGLLCYVFCIESAKLDNDKDGQLMAVEGSSKFT